MKRQMLKEHFEDFENVNKRKSELEKWFDLGIFTLTGESKETPYGVYYVYYKINKYNPLVYLLIVFLFFVSIFEYGIKGFSKELKKEWNMKEKLEVRNSIFEKYMAQ